MGSTWVMNDESLPEYRNMLLQMETGLKWVNETFGVHPRVAWQIDPFGNSAVSPAIFSSLGYDSIILNRVGTTLAHDLEEASASEFIWSAAPVESGQTNQLFAHALALSRYQAPVEFKYQPANFPFWIHPQADCSVNSLEANYKACMQLYWREVIKPTLQGTKHHKVFSIFGDDFAFKNADYSFKYLDKFIEVFEDHAEEVYNRTIKFKFATV